MDHTRHIDIFRAENLSVTLIGAGGIGAAAALALGKMGVGWISLYDNDHVDDLNLPTQLHRLSDVGRSKVEAVQALVMDFSDDSTVEANCARVSARAALEDYIVISAVDSIQARKDIWEAVQRGKVRWYLDARMAAEEFHLFCVDMQGETGWYKTMLAAEDDLTVPEIACTAKATIYTSFISAGRIGLAVKRIAMGEANPRLYVYNIAKDQVIVVK